MGYSGAFSNPPSVSAHDAAKYAANVLIMELTEPQPPNSFISIGDEQIVALQKLANIFQTSFTTKPISAAGVPDSAPSNHPCTHSQTKKFANAALTPPQGTKLLQTQPKQPINQQKEGDLFPEPPIDITHHHKPRIVPIISNLQPKYPTKHEGLQEDPFPLIQVANSITDPNTGKQLEYKQLIIHPDSKVRQTWQCSSANEFCQLAQGVCG